MTDICNYPKRDLFIRINFKCPYAGYYLRWYFNGWHYWHFRPGEQIVKTEGELYNTLGKKRIAIGTGNITYDQVTVIRTLLLTKEIQIYTESGWVNVYIDPSTMVIYDNEVNGYEVELIINIGSKEITYLSGFSPVEYVPTVPVIPDPGICEVIIGTQVWMCYNYASAYPGSKVYNNDESNRDVYGGLYTWDQIMTPGFCPTGWKIPSEDDFNTLITYLAGAAVAGGKLKEIGFTHWDNPNTGAVDSYNFTARGAGYWNYLFGTFFGLKQNTRLWTSTEKSETNAATALLEFDSAAISLGSSYKGWGFSVRLLKTSKSPARDYDGNDYDTVIIGNQEWFVQNLKTTHYKNGVAIPNITDDLLWGADVNGAYCWYDNDIANKEPHGALYNWYAVNNANGLAPEGWRIPSVADINVLTNNLGGWTVAGGKLKETGLVYWNAPNTGATNEVGFTGRGSGIREAPLMWIFIDKGSFGYIATSDNPGGFCYAYLMQFDSITFPQVGLGKSEGISIRCMRDV